MFTASWPVRLSATSKVSCGLGRVAYGSDFEHQLLVDMLAPGGVEDQHVVPADPRRGHGAFGDLERALTGNDGKRGDARLLTEDFQLLHGGGTVDVERRHQHALLLARLQHERELGGGGGLARSLQADHQDGRGCVPRFSAALSLPSVSTNWS